MNDFLLQDRLQKIRQINDEYDLEHNAYISYSAGKDSNVLSALFDLALPNNKIPRVYINTGIELNAVLNFFKEKAAVDDRFVMVNPTRNIRQVLDEYGYPFKSKEHACKLYNFKKGSKCESLKKYFCIGEYADRHTGFECPQKLLYQIKDDFKLKVSDKCCYKLKKEPVHSWAKENKRPISILGLRSAEGGQRANKQGCVVFSGKHIKSFSPLRPMSDEWVDWFIKTYNIALPIVYSQPYNFKRTGCKACPFNPKIQEDLDTLKKFFPAEYKQAEMIWKPVFNEYRRIGYRLKEL